MSGIVGIVLAAGSSRRLGSPKQLLAYRGQTLVESVVDAACGAELDAVAVVLGAHREEVQKALAGWPVMAILNAEWEEGMASSIRAGVAWVESTDAEAVVLMVCDQPQLSSEHIDRLIGAYRQYGGVVASAYAGKAGVPALFPRAELASLRALRGDHGARTVVRTRSGVTRVVWPDGELDVDTPLDAERLGASGERTLH